MDTCRSSGLSIGPIPWTVIVQYAEYAKLDEDIIEAFVRIIRIMDDAFLKEVNKTEGG